MAVKKIKKCTETDKKNRDKRRVAESGAANAKPSPSGRPVALSSRSTIPVTVITGPSVDNVVFTVGQTLSAVGVENRLSRNLVPTAAAVRVVIRRFRRPLRWNPKSTTCCSAGSVCGNRSRRFQSLWLLTRTWPRT